MSPADNFAKSLPSFSSVAHSLTLLSTSRVDTACSPESASSQKKHFSIECPGVQDELDRRAFIGLSGAEISACFLFCARSSFVLLNKSLQDLCHDALRFRRVSSIPEPSSIQSMLNDDGSNLRCWNIFTFLAKEI